MAYGQFPSDMQSRTQCRARGLHVDTGTLQDESLCAVQELLDGYKETGVAYLDLSYFPTDALTEPGPAACVAGELKLVPGQFGMPSLVTCCLNLLFLTCPSASRACQLHPWMITSFIITSVRAVAPCRGCSDEHTCAHSHWAALSVC